MKIYLACKPFKSITEVETFIIEFSRKQVCPRLLKDQPVAIVMEECMSPAQQESSPAFHLVISILAAASQ